MDANGVAASGSRDASDCACVRACAVSERGLAERREGVGGRDERRRGVGGEMEGEEEEEGEGLRAATSLTVFFY